MKENNLHEFAFTNRNPFKDEESILSFGKKCEALGFKMDSGQSFCKKFPEAYKSVEELSKIITQIRDIDLIGSAIYSKWRYYTNWALPSEEKPTEWFNIMMNHLAQLSIEHYEVPSLNKIQLLRNTNVPKNFYILEYYETNNLIYFSACKEKTPTRFYSMGNGVIDDYCASLAKWKTEDKWFLPMLYEDDDVFLEIKECKNLAEIIESEQ